MLGARSGFVALLFACMSMIFASLSPLTASAATSTLTHSSPVMLDVTDTTFTITGLAAPGALVTIFDGGVVVGTTVADSSGQFTKTLTAVTPGLHSLGIQFLDSFGLVSDRIEDIVSATSQTNTVINYTLPPTLQVVPDQAEQGQEVIVRGTTTPGATVTIVIDGVPLALQPQVQANGQYQIAIPTAGYTLGQHVVTTQFSNGTATSPVSSGKIFTVSQPADTPEPVEGADAEEGQAPDTPSISSPRSPVTVSTSTLRLDGQAAPNTQIVIYLDGEPVGSAFSRADGTWTLLVELTESSHQITAVACREDLCSPASEAISVSFPGSPVRCSPLAFQLEDYRIYGVYQDKEAELSIIDIQTSDTPAEFLVSWGDGTSERFSLADRQDRIAPHPYREIGQYSGSITIRDQSECQYERFFSVEVIEQPATTPWVVAAAATVGGIALVSVGLLQWRLRVRKLRRTS